MSVNVPTTLAASGLPPVVVSQITSFEHVPEAQYPALAPVVL